MFLYYAVCANSLSNKVSGLIIAIINNTGDARLRVEDEAELRKRSVLDHVTLDVNITVLLAIMTSMGAIFPLVGIAAAVSIFIFTYFTQI